MRQQAVISFAAACAALPTSNTFHRSKAYFFALLVLVWASTVCGQFDNCTGQLSWIGDGFCDASLNFPDCGYDGGDCCECTCVDGPFYSCGSGEFTCKDISCLDSSYQAGFPNCTGNLLLINDGECDTGNNNAECGYDGGDCCLCTCVMEGGCGFSRLDCVDPSAEKHLYQCRPQPPTAALCAPDVQRHWVVKSSADAGAFAEAINCSGGSFNVEWIGSVVVGTTFHVADGTFVNITGVGGSLRSSIDGSLAVRLFTVVNASLHLSDVSLKNGFSVVGGAIAASSSNLSLTHMSFSGNRASGIGGAIYVTDHSNIHFDGNTTMLFNNSAVGFAGALHASGNSVIRFSGKTAHVCWNTAGNSGGAIAIDHSQLIWHGKAIIANNKCGANGGAVDVASDSFVTWMGNVLFSENLAGFVGGGLLVRINSTASLSADIVFERNSASISGGALSVAFNSSVSWSGPTLFTNNSAIAEGGGAIRMWDAKVSWNSSTSFLNNSARSGGGMFITSSSNVSWNGPNTSFIDNEATMFSGGAIVVTGSHVSWSGATYFEQNAAMALGGAILMWNATRVECSGDTTFARNKASSGGAIYIYRDVRVEWIGTTTFISNKADVEGGAVGSIALDASTVDDLMSSLSIAGTTIFYGNICKMDGGAMVLAGGLSVLFNPSANVTFRQNVAGGAGGAVFISGADVGPTFNEISFISNSAQLGGGVYSTSSGNSKFNLNGETNYNPTTFYRCSFVSNTATATGGAIQSAAGQDLVQDSTFVGNMARAGGALYLAGTSSIVNCSFINNVADEASGAAISNIGYVSSMTNITFAGNDYNCEHGTYRAYDESDNPFEVLCVECEVVCEQCTFEDAFRVPSCESTIDHSTSEGGSTTIEGISIDSGYWRATAFSKDTLECYNTDACLGGVTGASEYCRAGYEGPYCAICNNGYTMSLGFVCDACSKNNIGGIMLAIAAFFASMLAIVLLGQHLVPRKIEQTKRGFISKFMGSIPFQSLKIIIVVWQILTQFASVANVVYPGIYQRFLDGVNMLNFDISWVLSVSCVLDLDFYDRLLLVTLVPIVAVAFLGVTYSVAVLRKCYSDRGLADVRHKHLSAVLLLTFLVYSSVSSILFQTFACDSLDDGNIYLRADFRILCDSPKHAAFTVYAGFMAALYSLGIPALYAWLLLKDRDLLVNRDNSDDGSNKDVRVTNQRVRSTSTLWKPYKPKRFYYEIIECMRRILLTGVVVFYPNSAAQIAVTLTIAFTFAMVSEGLDPYTSSWDTWVSRMGHVVVFISVYVALLLKLDVSREQLESQKTFEVVLIFAHICMVTAVLGETFVLACSVRTERHEESSPRDRASSISENDVIFESKADAGDEL